MPQFKTNGKRVAQSNRVTRARAKAKARGRKNPAQVIAQIAAKYN